MLIVAMFFMVSNVNAQESEMEQLVNKTISEVKAPADMLNAIAKLQRIETMYPDSVMPKSKRVMLSLEYAISQPSAKESPKLIESSNEMLQKMEQMPAADSSDVEALWAFYYLDLIVQNPMENGPKYYMQVSSHVNKSLELNPDNELAKTVKGWFEQGMKQ
ncbi:MAG: hypothetical protein ACOYJG_00975 [Prevotella sp.]